MVRQRLLKLDPKSYDRTTISFCNLHLVRGQNPCERRQLAFLEPRRAVSPDAEHPSPTRPRLSIPRRHASPLAAAPALCSPPTPTPRCRTSPVTRRCALQLAAAPSTATRRRVSTATLAASTSPASSPPTPLSSPRLSASRCRTRSALAAAPLGTPPPRLHSPPPLRTSRPSLYATLFSHGLCPLYSQSNDEKIRCKLKKKRKQPEIADGTVVRTNRVSKKRRSRTLFDGESSGEE